LIAPQVADHGGEVADVVGDGVEFGAASPDFLEVGGIIGGQVARGLNGRGSAGRSGRSR
jgi:hypothetical protein